MSYRSIKRILGESSLERKIRILFTISILILIGGSFLWVNRITEDQIRKNMRDKAQELASSFLLRIHLKARHETGDETGQFGVFNAMAKEFGQRADYLGNSLILEGSNSRHQIKTQIADGSQETEIVSRLSEEVRLLQESQDKLVSKLDGVPIAPVPDGNLPTDPPPVSPDVIVEDSSDHLFSGDEYAFYVPILFKADCLSCHYTVYSDPEIGAEMDRKLDIARQRATALGDDAEYNSLTFQKHQASPPVVLRITLPHKDARSAINRSRAILITVAIVTAALSTIALYLIVRYVIVKPLKHLRDVADEIGHGRMDLRAELNTGDEFEELSRSFNRMLRHLLDTQVKLQDVNRDLDNKVDEQAQLNLKLHEMNQLKSEFLANMSHELRTPLNSIIGFSEILENAKALENKQKRFATNIRKSGRLLLDLINDILDLAKLEAGKMEVNANEFRIDQLARQLCDMVRHLAETKNIQLVLNIDKELPALFQDEIKVRQILTNLLSNAIKFTPEGGRINVSAERNADDMLVLSVRDTGVGIAEDEREIIFEKFRQGPSAIGGDTLTREITGTGLGLSIVSEICILLGGTIDLESEVGKGSTFTATLPWTFKVLPRINSEIAQSIDEITKQGRVDFARTNDVPQPGSESGEHRALSDSKRDEEIVADQSGPSTQDSGESFLSQPDSDSPSPINQQQEN